MRCGVVVFPGSNCDHDVYHVLRHVLDQDVRWLWHADTDLGGCDLIVVPGGFSYGDYLRAGALASLSPVMGAIRAHAERGGLVLGICNGFQILLESGLLPGAMLRNRDLRFQCEDVYLRVERNDLPFTCGYDVGSVLRMPIAHAEGNYSGPPETIADLEANRRVIFRYVDAEGRRDDERCVNGSANSIAGLASATGNVLGMMPHPERCAEEILGNTDGLGLFRGVVEGVVEAARASL